MYKSAGIIGRLFHADEKKMKDMISNPESEENEKIICFISFGVRFFIRDSLRLAIEEMCASYFDVLNLD